jgi:hypothetical protein
MAEKVDRQTGEIIEYDALESMASPAQMKLMEMLIEKASAHPRDLEEFEKKVLAAAARAAEDFYYYWRVKNHVTGCEDRRNCNCSTSPVQGGGVGLARFMSSQYRNCMVRNDIEAQTEEHWNARSTFIDFENVFIRSEPKVVSKYVITKGGKAFKAREKELEKLLQIGLSKCERDVILRSMPVHIREAAVSMAMAAAQASKKPIGEQIARLVSKFSSLDVSRKQLERYLGFAFTKEGMEAAEKDAGEICAQLRGLITALASGEVSLEEIFGEAGAASASPSPGTPPETGTSPGTRPVSVDDVVPPSKKEEKQEAPKPAPDSFQAKYAQINEMREALRMDQGQLAGIIDKHGTDWDKVHKELSGMVDKQNAAAEGAAEESSGSSPSVAPKAEEAPQPAAPKKPDQAAVNAELWR